MANDSMYFRRKADGTLAESYLIQRLERPRGGFLAGAFSFGGGMKKGGLSDGAMGLLKGIFSFDYMGSAEFEWGSVPYALSQIAKKVKKYEAFKVEVDLSKVPAHWKRKGELGEGFKDVYVIAQKGDREEYTKRILKWASEAYNSGMKETTHLARTLRPVEEWDNNVQGWLDVSNGVFFFTDRQMFDKTASLFGLDSDLFN